MVKKETIEGIRKYLELNDERQPLYYHFSCAVKED